MAYTTVTGTNSANFLTFVGITGPYGQTLVNPYTGYTVTINDVKNVNNAIYDGRGGTDTLNLSIAGDVLSLLDASGTVMVTSIEIINASEGGDIINFAFADATYGNIIIRGAEGDDILWGNVGNDSLNGADGNDNMIGGAGNDTVFGGAGNDYLDGGTGADYMTGGAGDDELHYTADAIWSGGYTLASLGSSLSFAAMIQLDGKNQSYDTFHGDANDDGTVTSNGNDTLILTSGSDVLVANENVSPQMGVFFTDRVMGIETIDAGDGDDVVDLSAPANYGPVTINGGTGNDVLAGNSDNDTLNGNSGNDILDGGAGNDILNGGTGDDTYYYGPGDGSDIITETSGADSIVFESGITLSDLTLTVVGADLLVGIGAETITIVDHYAADLSGRVETLVFADGSTFNLGAYVPNDNPIAADDAFTGVRNDVITGNVLADNGAGLDHDANGDTLAVHADTITTANGGTVTLAADGTFSYAPSDNFVGHDSFDYTLDDGRGGMDTATVSLTVDYKPTDIVGTDGDNNLDGTAANDTVFALDGNDTIKGQDGNDTIYGGAGDDTLYGDDSILTGATQDKSFADTVIVPNLKEGIAIQNLDPSGIPALGINPGNLSVDYDATATITFRKGYAGYDNSFGSFGVAADGTITMATMEWANVKTAGIDTAHTINLPVGANGGDYGFFVIGDGNNANGGYAGLNITGDGNIHFVYDYGQADARDAKITDTGSKVSLVYDDGVTTKVLGGDVYLTTDRGASTAINDDGKTHVVSGLMDTNNLSMTVTSADLAAKPVSITKDDITVSAIHGVLQGNGDRIGIQDSNGNATIGGNEAARIDFAHAADKVTLTLSDVVGGHTGIDFKVYLEGSNTPIDYEFNIMNPVPCDSVTINLTDHMFGGLISHIEVSSTDNSALGTETFYINNITAEIPDGIDHNTLRIGFEDLYNTGDADYEDVLFDLDVKSVHIGDVNGGNDYLDGGAGNDTLYGEGGNDILVMGLGGDHAFGGFGADIFAINKIDGLVDTIHDYNAAEGDKINIADVLEGYDPLAGDIANFVHLVQNGADTQIQVNATGDAGAAFVTAAIVMGGTGTDDLAALIASGHLVVDHGATT